MGSSLDLKSRSNQRNEPKAVKNPLPLPQSNQTPKFQAKGVRLGPGNVALHSGHRQVTEDNILARSKSLKNLQRKSLPGRLNGDDELVKHMSNLPGYLLQPDRGGNPQEKALNVGVLDWALLEKWKHNQIPNTSRGANVASCSGSRLSLKQKTGASTSSRVPQPESSKNPSSSSNSSCRNGPQFVSPAAQNAKQIHDSRNASKSTVKIQKEKPQTYKSSERFYSEMMHEKERQRHLDQEITSEKLKSSPKVRDGRLLSYPKGGVSNVDVEAHKRKGNLKDIDAKGNEKDDKIISEVEDLPSKTSNGGSLCSAAPSETTKKVVKLQNSKISLARQHSRAEQKIALLQPKQKPDGCPEVFQHVQRRTSFDMNVSVANSSSDLGIFSPTEMISSELCPESSFSCPLPSHVQTDATSGMIAANDCSMESSSGPLRPFSSSKARRSPLMDAEHSENNSSDFEIALSNLEHLEQEDRELDTSKGRNPSPNRRFSFGLGRMGRSFSFKEGFTVPRLSSTYVTPMSGPVKCEASAFSNTSDKGKANGHNRARSSPLRRLIDPILKSKAANSHHSVEGNLDFPTSWPATLNDSHCKEAHRSSTVGALLQLTVKNGLPLFKFVVENDSNILAATVKSIASGGKNDTGHNYTFYTVNEIKKKSGGWIRPGSKERNHGYIYNAVGQMKVSCSYFFDLSGQNSNGRCTLRESVLFGVELRQTDQDSPKLIPKRELAAVVIKIPLQNLSHDDGHIQHLREFLVDDGSFCSERENVENDSALLILPGAVHGSPSTGEPSPLIDRWKSGGTCDCGGWDVGCKLRLLSNRQRSLKIPTISKACPIPDRFELFDQEGPQKNKPAFGLAALKDGIFSVEFSSSISLLQAFFISVTIISSQKPSDILDNSNVASEAKLLKEPKFNERDEAQGKAPARYAPNPPHSPVGRV